MNETPTPEQIEAAQREADPLGENYWIVVGVVAAAILGALAVVLDVHWLFAPGPTL